MTFIPLGTESA